MRDHSLVGSHDWSMVAGTSSYGNKWTTYNRLVHELQPKPKKSLFFWGSALEEPIIKLAILDDSGNVKKWIREEYDLPEKAFLRMGTAKRDLSVYWEERYSKESEGVFRCRDTQDAKITESRRHVKSLVSIECKTAFYSDRSLYSGHVVEGEPIVDGCIPDGYYDQCQIHLFANKTKVCLVPVLFNKTDSPLVYVIHRNDKRIEELRLGMIIFWANHIAPKITPPADESEAMLFYLKHQEQVSDDYITAAGNMWDVAVAYVQAKKEKEKSEAQFNMLKNRMIQLIGEKKGIDYGEYGKVQYIANRHGTRTFGDKSLKLQLIKEDYLNE